MMKRPLEPDPDHTGVGKRPGQQRAFPLTGQAPWPPALAHFCFLETRSMIQGLYLITPQGSDEQILHVAREGLRGGVSVVQYRDKERSADAKVSLARQLVQLIKEAGATFLVNDSP